MEEQSLVTLKNPKGAGRKKGVSTIRAEQAREFIIKQVCDHLRPIIDKLIEQAEAGDKEAIKILFDRGFGKPKESVEHTGAVTTILQFVSDIENRRNE